MAAATRILIADDHEIVRAGFRRLLDSSGGVEVVAEASSGEEAVELYERHQPDLVLMDLSMPPGSGGLDAIQKIRAKDPAAKIIVLTVQECEPYPSRVLKAGALGYLTKRCAPEELLEAVRQVRQGKRYVPQEIRQVMESDEGSALRQLTKRELQIFNHLASGKTTSEIAELMFISQKTVHAHRSNILGKLGLSKTSDLIHYAIRHGLVDP